MTLQQIIIYHMYLKDKLFESIKKLENGFIHQTKLID